MTAHTDFMHPPQHLVDTWMFIARYMHAHRMAPSYREIAAGVGVASKCTIHHRLKRLNEMGYIQRQPGKRLAMRLVVWPPPDQLTQNGGAHD